RARQAELTGDQAMANDDPNAAVRAFNDAIYRYRRSLTKSKPHAEAKREFVIFPGSGGVKRQIQEPDPRLNGESIADVLTSVGGQIRDSWCGPCFGQGPDALDKGQRAITSFNRNWQNRMGLGGEGFLASPSVVAASALLGYMAPPSELELEWNAETYAV
ncbi:MAG: aconitase family protein, partial [Planctomycetota bacterium]